MKTILSILDKKQPKHIWRLSILFIILLCSGMVLIENSVDFKVLLVMPIILASWYGSTRSGASIALFTAITLILMYWALGFFKGGSLLPVYNTFVALLTYLLISIIVTDFRNVHRIEVVAADTDSLTGINNPRRFYAELANEILRFKRHGRAFSLIYIDVDNFKHINDTLGHSAGNEVLISLAKCLYDSLRNTDIVARIGGDEFVCLLPETDDKEVKSAMLKVNRALHASFGQRSRSISLSIGVMTFEAMPDDVLDAVKLADELMYEVKNNGKNNIAYKVWRGIAEPC